MAEDFRFGIDVEATVSNKEEAILALQQLKREMEEVSQGVKIDVSEEDINKAKIQIEALEKTIDELGTSGGDFKAAFSKNLESVQSDFKDTAKEAKRTTKEIEDLNRAAQNGGFSNISKTAKIATRDIQGTSSQIDSLKQNLQQGVGQTLAFGAITGIQNALSSAIDNATELDEIMTDISIVSGKTNDEMQKYRDYAGEAADALGTMGSDYLEASLIYEQQGGVAAYYAKDLADATVTAANISRESTSQMSEYLTATINGFDLLSERGGQAATYITDVLAKLGAASGSDLAEIATGLTRTANTARDVGFEFEEISTMIATVSEVTRRTPETIGNAFKSMLTTFTQLREAGGDELEEFTNKVEEAFKLGGIEDISVFDNGQLREASDIFKDIADRWDTMNREQQSLVSESVAGKYQAETFRAFMNNQERYNELLDEAYGAAGTSAQQQLIYMDSLEAKTKQFGNQWEIISTNIIDSDMFKGLIDDATNLLKIVGAQEKGFQTLATALSPVVGIFGQLFGSRFVGEAVQNKQLNDLTKKTLEYTKEQKETNKGNTDELNRQITAARKINDIMSTLGDEAGKNFEGLVEEADKLQEKIEAISLSPDQLDAKIKDKAQQALTSGGTKGFQGAQFQAALNEEESNLMQRNQELQALQAQNEEMRNKLDLYNKQVLIATKSTTKEAERLQILQSQSAQEAITNQLGEKANQRVQELVNDLREWKILSKSNNKDLEYKAEMQDEIAGIQVELNALLGTEYEAQQKILKANLAKEESLKKQQHIRAAENVVSKGLSSGSQSKAQLEAELALNQKTQTAYERAAKKTDLATKATQGLSLAYSTLVPIMATVKSVQEEQISVQDGVIASMQSVGSMLMFAPGLWTKLAGAATLGLSMIVDKLDLFTSSAEKAQKINESLIRSVISLKEKTSSNQTILNGIEETYTKLQGVDASELLKSGDSEAISEYLDVASKLVQVYPELLKYYDEHGQAVVDLSSSYDLLINKQKEEQIANSKILSENAGNFYTQYSAEIEKALRDQEEYGKKLKSAQEELTLAKTSGKDSDISKALEDISEYSTKLSEAQSTISSSKDNIQTNIIQPFIEATGSVSDLSIEAQNMLKGILSENFTSENVYDSISSGDSSKLETLKQNLELLSNGFSELERNEEGSGEVLKGYLDNVPQLALQFSLLNDGATNFAELMKNIITFGETGSSPISTTMSEAEKAKDSLSDMNGSLKETLEILNSYTSDTSVNKALSDMSASGVDSELVGQAERAAEISKQYREDAAGTVEYTEAQVEAIQESTKALEKQNDALEGVREGYANSLDSVEGLEQATKNLSNLSDVDAMLSGLSADLPADRFKENIEEIKGIIPEIGEQMESAFEKGGKSAEDQAAIIQSALQTTAQTASSLIEGIMGDNENYFQQWKSDNAEQISRIEETFGIDASNVKTLNELRAAAMESNLTNEATFQQEVGKLSRSEVETTSKNQKINTENRALQLRKQLEDSQMIEQLKVIDTQVSEEIKYDTRKKWWQGIIDLINGQETFSDEEEYNKAYDARFSELAEQALKRQANYEKYLKANDAQEALKEGVYNDVMLGAEWSTVDPSSYLKDRLTQAQKNAAAMDTNSSSGDGGGDTGGGGKDKEDEKEVENLRLTLNQYYKLENALKKIQDQYDALGKKKDAAYGEDKLRLMTQEQEMLVKQTNLLKQHSAALAQEQADIKNNLSSYGFTFDEQGEVRNLNERLTALQNEANRQTGVAKEAAIAAVQSLQEEASRYSEITFDLIPDKQKAIEEAKQTFSQIAREKVEYTVQIKVDRYSMQREVLDVVKEMQDTFGTLDEKMDYTARQAQTSLNEIALLQKAMDEVRQNPALTDSDREELLQQYQKDLLSAVSDARSAYKEMAEIQQDFISQTIDQIDEVTDGYDRIIDKSQTMIDKLKDLYGNKNFGQIEKLYDTQNKALEAQLNHLQNSQRALIKYRDTLEKGTDAWKDANDQIIEMGEAIDNNLIAKIDLLKAKFEDFSNSVFDKFNNLFGVWGLDGAVDDFDKLINKSNEFMSTYDKITVIGNKIKSINDEIAKTTDPNRAAELAKYRDEELVSLIQQDQVSQDEYERALKLYDIKQKELALQERQNASRIAQLVRDENGNMSYEYVRQETEDTQKALDELNEAKNDLYEFDSKKVQDASKKIFEIIQNYQSKLKDLESKGLSPEDYKAELDKLLAGTQAEIDAQQAIVDKWMQNVGKDGFKNIIDLFGQGTISADQLGVSQKMMEQLFGALQNGSLTYQDILSGNYDKFADSIGSSAEEVKKAMDGIMQIVLGDNQTITDALTDASNKWTSTAQENVSQLGDAYAKYMTEANRVLNEYNGTTGTLNNLLNQTNQSSKNVTQSIKNQTDAMIRTKRETDNTSSSVKNLERMLIGSGSGGLFGSFIKIKNEQNNKLQPSIKTTTSLTSSLSSTVNITAGKYKYMGERAEEARQRVIAYSDKKTKQGVKDVEAAGNVAKDNATKYDTWRKNVDKTKSSTEDLIKTLSKLPGMENFLGQATGVAGATAGNKVGKASKGASFDTGGYTGTWDNSTNNATGRMAILHEKEIVLNKYDTSNLLEAVKLQRNLTEKLQNAKLSASSTINKVNETVNNNKIDKSIISQPVTIHAEFPNANNSSEIEAAFQGLFGKASTFIGKK